MPTIEHLSAQEILDSRGRPTVQATCTLAQGARGTASVPSGASTGAAEALELRDGGSRYGGLGCRRAVANINDSINSALCGQFFVDQAALDRAICQIDGTPNKSRLGANALLAVSLAFARAFAFEQNVPLYDYFAALIDQPLRLLPQLTINLFSGGKHAGQQVAIQDVLIFPVSAKTIDESLAMAYDVYQAAAALLLQTYGMRLLRADEGGMAPPCESAEAMLQLAVTSIVKAGYAPGEEVALAVDVAATHFFNTERYDLDSDALTSSQMIRRLAEWTTRYPLISVEDGLSEEDWANWPHLTEALRERAIVLGDDFLCTNPIRIQRAMKSHAANALLLKVNQIGTLTEAAEACQLARSADWRVTISARSGETEDDWLADLAVGWSADYIKVGSITQSERLAKYNRLLAIERTEGLPLNHKAVPKR